MTTTPFVPDAPSDRTIAGNAGPDPDFGAPQPVAVLHRLANDRLRPVHDAVRTPTIFHAASELRVKERIVWRCATELDARGRMPPVPLNVIRAAYGELLPGEMVYLRTAAKPCDVLDGLNRLGFPASSECLPDASWRTAVRRT